MTSTNVNPGTWQTAAEQTLGSPLTALQALSGGDFARAYRAELAGGDPVFIKTHSNPPPGFFTTEAAGLSWLRESASVNVPAVLGACDTPPWLAMQWIEIGSARRAARVGEAEFGRQMASLHRQPQAQYGRPDNRTTGSLALPNTPTDNWVDFYAQRRLLPLGAIAAERKILSVQTITLLHQLAGRLGEFANTDEPASLLHGDLWAGNRVIDEQGVSWVIDPAAHCGHREFDLAMMRLFGGFGEACFAAYDESYALAPGADERVELHQLAPLLVHAIKFGGHYVAASEAVIERYGG